MRWTAAVCVAAWLTATEAAMAAVIDLGDIPRGVTQTLFTYEFDRDFGVADTYEFDLLEQSVLIFQRVTDFTGPQPIDLFDSTSTVVFSCPSQTFCVTDLLQPGGYSLFVSGVGAENTPYSWTVTTVTPLPAAGMSLAAGLAVLIGLRLRKPSAPA
jgi:hypothetical protein